MTYYLHVHQDRVTLMQGGTRIERFPTTGPNDPRIAEATAHPAGYTLHVTRI